MSAVYRILVKAQLDSYWMHWFGEMTLTNLENDETELVGPVEDQEALHHLLEKIHDLNISLITVEQLEDRREQNGLSKNH